MCMYVCVYIYIYTVDPWATWQLGTPTLPAVEKSNFTGGHLNPQFQSSVLTNYGSCSIVVDVCCCFIVVQSLSHVWIFVTPIDCSPPGSSVHGILRARILEKNTWRRSFSMESSWPRDWTHVSCIDKHILYTEPVGKH